MIYFYRSTVSDQKMKKQTRLTPGCWVKCEHPSDANLRWLRETLRLDRNTLKGVLDPYEVPRFIRTKNWTYWIARLPDTNDEEAGFTTPIMLAMNDHYIVTVSRDKLDNLWKPFKDSKRIATTQRGRFFLTVTHAIISQYQHQLALINRRMRAIMLNVSNMVPKDVEVFSKSERKVNDYLDALGPMYTALEGLLSGIDPHLFADEADLINGVTVELSQVIARCKSELNTITSLRDSYQTVMDVKLNENMRMLTIITIVMTIPTVVAGLWGMNVKVPMMHTEYDFWVIVICITVIMALTAIILVRKR